MRKATHTFITLYFGSLLSPSYTKNLKSLSREFIKTSSNTCQHISKCVNVHCQSVRVVDLLVSSGSVPTRSTEWSTFALESAQVLMCSKSNCLCCIMCFQRCSVFRYAAGRPPCRRWSMDLDLVVQ